MNITGITVQLLVVGLVPAAGWAISQIFDKVLTAPATAAKLAAETKLVEAQLLEQHQAFLYTIVRLAMAYAEQHQVEIEQQWESKAAYVKHVVVADPRFAGLGIGIDAIEHFIEDVWFEYFKDMKTDNHLPLTVAA